MRSKVRVEIYEEDPFKGCGCNCGPRVSSVASVEKVRRMLTERNEIVQKLREEFKEKIEIERNIVSARKSLWMFPERVGRLLAKGTQLPFVLIDSQVALVGAFPSLEWFRLLINRYLEGRTLDK